MFEMLLLVGISCHVTFIPQFELSAMVDALEGHPSIVVWVPFNEAWGQHRTLEVGLFIRKKKGVYSLG